MATTRFRIGTGVVCQLKDTPDMSGVEVTLTGVFRHGGIMHSEIESRLRELLSELDIDGASSTKSKPQNQA